MMIKKFINSIRVFIINFLGISDLLTRQKKTTEQVLDLCKAVNGLAVGLSNLVRSQENTQEYLVNLATLQEEMMHQLETAQILLVKVNKVTGQVTQSSPEKTLLGDEALDKELDEFLQKKKAMN